MSSSPTTNWTHWPTDWRATCWPKAAPGDRVGLLFDQPVYAYIGMLAVVKVNAAYVPLDAAIPADRISYILRDAEAGLVLSLSHLRDRLQESSAAVLCLDQAAAEVASRDGGRLTDLEQGEPPDDLCYIVYTSGSTGRPKGVAINHASICNFVRVAAEVCGITPQDRVYQGPTIAFDFSVEETWIPWASGATVVSKPGGFSSCRGRHVPKPSFPDGTSPAVTSSMSTVRRRPRSPRRGQCCIRTGP